MYLAYGRDSHGQKRSGWIDGACYFFHSEGRTRSRESNRGIPDYWERVIHNQEWQCKGIYQVAREAGFEVPADTKLIIGEATSTDISEPLSHEKLFPVLSMYKSKDFDDAVQKADQLVQGGGIGHTAGIYIDVVNNKEKLDKFNFTRY